MAILCDHFSLPIRVSFIWESQGVGKFFFNLEIKVVRLVEAILANQRARFQIYKFLTSALVSYKAKIYEMH